MSLFADQVSMKDVSATSGSRVETHNSVKGGSCPGAEEAHGTTRQKSSNKLKEEKQMEIRTRT